MNDRPVTANAAPSSPLCPCAPPERTSAYSDRCPKTAGPLSTQNATFRRCRRTDRSSKSTGSFWAVKRMDRKRPKSVIPARSRDHKSCHILADGRARLPCDTHGEAHAEATAVRKPAEKSCSQIPVRRCTILRSHRGNFVDETDPNSKIRGGNV